MSRIIITADSTADIPAEIAQKYNIRISPLHVLYDDEDYADTMDTDGGSVIIQVVKK